MSHKCKHTHHMWHIVTILHRITTHLLYRIHPHPPCLSGCCHVTGTRSSHARREDDARLVDPTDGWFLRWHDTLQRVHICDRSQGKDCTNSMSTFHFRINLLSFSMQSLKYLEQMHFHKYDPNHGPLHFRNLSSTFRVSAAEKLPRDSKVERAVKSMCYGSMESSNV